MAVLGLILNFLGGAVLIYYGDKTGSFPDRPSNNVNLIFNTCGSILSVFFL